jgi:hypothetical protein
MSIYETLYTNITHTFSEYDVNDQILIIFSIAELRNMCMVQVIEEKRKVIAQHRTLNSIKRKCILHRNGSSRSFGFNRIPLPHEP